MPSGMQNLGLGTAKESPWRAGANENTVFTVSHDVMVGGKKLAAGSYGLHMAPQQNEWTIIFSKNSSSWGSFFFTKNVAAHPKSWNAHDSLAEAYSANGDQAQAPEHYQHALSMAPENQKKRIEGILAGLE